MALALIMMLGFLLLAARSHRSGADLKLVEVLLAAIFLMFVFGQSGG